MSKNLIEQRASGDGAGAGAASPVASPVASLVASQLALPDATRRGITAATLALLAGANATARAQPTTGEPLKVAFVYVSPIGEAGWRWSGRSARR